MPPLLPNKPSSATGLTFRCARKRSVAKSAWLVPGFGASKDDKRKLTMIDKFQDHASNERTYLAWIRTAIAIAGFGVLIEKLPSTPDNTWAGLALVSLSAALVLLASWRFLVIRKQITADRLDRASFGRIEVLFAAILAVLLLTVFVFLLGLVREG